MMRLTQCDPANVPLTEDGRFHIHPDELDAGLHAVRSGKDIDQLDT